MDPALSPPPPTAVRRTALGAVHPRGATHGGRRHTGNRVAYAWRVGVHAAAAATAAAATAARAAAAAADAGSGVGRPAPPPPPRRRRPHRPGGASGVCVPLAASRCAGRRRARRVWRGHPAGGRRQPAGAAGAPARVRAVVCADGLVAAGAAQGWLTGVVTRAVDPLEKWLAGDHRVSSFVSHQFRAMWIGRCHVGRSSGPAARAITAPLQSARPKIDWISVERVWTGARLVANVGVERDGAPARP